MKYCNAAEGRWLLPCGYPRQWLDDPRGGCLVDDDAPCGIPCIVGQDGLPLRDQDGRIVRRVNEVFFAHNSGGGCQLPPEARRLLADTPGSKAVIVRSPNGARFVRVFTSPDIADSVCPDWTHEDFANDT